MSVMQDFKKFAMRGNVLDMAVGVIIGAAFGKVIASLVTDILMPPIGLALGGVDFSNLFINLSGTPAATLAEAVEAGLPVISYGLFINSIINFLIQAWAIFWVIRFANKMSKPEPTPAPKRKCPFCFSDIDDNATRCPNCTSQL
ncbi:MAG: large conductance mechanosensitive channel protein MscL [Synergistaceae bacterium]|jgi:large conductance mechanosensitive channel|nr:large conductance mechanosensitive channel protein MscL [Synergistaceae bacterium]MCK9435940.1 large conductance mechanosensitive channel protein MscL [Synergistaceae bacterium]MDD3318862.1 large conductance mechanosensitive channel protein MscL [Synergistaceae bacterium]MDD3672467.1 large conductance mechanosensitive channel protein MscL [Synergistaceae bacterium]MDD3963679.1 large conductance mechanosensitive channel protein MscL [Synergistaceae bacterium]